MRRKGNEILGYCFAVCTDGSEKSLKGLEEAKKLATNPVDEIYTLCLLSPAFDFQKSDVDETIKEKLKELGIRGGIDYIDGPETDPYTPLLDFVNANTKIQFDFLLVKRF